MKLLRNIVILAILVALGAYGYHMLSGDHHEDHRGKTVAFNAWGGSDNINAYLQWASGEMEKREGITIDHVKLTNTADAVSRILAEKTAGRDSDGSVDLIWVNGENFASMKANGLLRDDAWAFDLANFAFTDPEALPAIVNDFAIPTDGLESPWGRAQLVFAHDTADVQFPPRSAAELAAWIKANPGRFTYPRIPDFTGMALLKQILLEVTESPALLAAPPGEADSAEVLAPLWAWLDDVTPHLRRRGRHYPANYAELVRLFADRETAIAFAYNPSEFSNQINKGVLPDTVRTYIHGGGTIANVHFLAIPFNAAAPEAAKRVADFLLSPEAQSRKANPEIWGDPTVLAMDKLPADARAVFESLPRGVATLGEAELTPSLPEPHPGWVKVIETGWLERYGSGG